MAGLVDDEAKGLQVLFFEPLQIAHERVPRMDEAEEVSVPRRMRAAMRALRQQRSRCSRGALGTKGG
jgi:hypothetical protein